MQLFPDIVELFILLFADDIILLSDTVAGLQTHVNVLARKACDLDLHVSLDKLNIVIFGSGGYNGKKDQSGTITGKLCQW